MNINLTLQYLEKKIPQQPKVAIVLGSGLSNVLDNLEDKTTIPYSKIPEYPQPSIAGHIGEFVFGFINQVPVLCARGRFHYYEGHSFETVQIPIRLFHSLGCKNLIITNAAGCLRTEWNLGDLMVINGLMDFTFRNNTISPKIVTNLCAKSKTLKIITKSVAKQKNITIREGVYCWTSGPSYETPAEIQEISKIGCDAVGMSTFPEFELAHKLGLNILGISCLTNYAAGISNQPLSHTEVLETTEKVKEKFATLLFGMLEKIN